MSDVENTKLNEKASKPFRFRTGKHSSKNCVVMPCLLKDKGLETDGGSGKEAEEMDENSLLYPALCHAARCQCLPTENHYMEILGRKPAWPQEVPSRLFARYGTMLRSKAKEKHSRQ